MKYRLSVIIFLSLMIVTLSAQSGKVKSVDGIEISYSVSGDGETALVFVHGWSCDKSYWKHQVGKLGHDYKFVLIDLAGHGESGTERKDYKIELFGDDVVSVISHLDLKKVILIGHSMGGSVILEAAKKLKGKVIGLIGVDTFQSFTDDWTAEQKEGFLKTFENDFIGTAKGFVRSMFPQTADADLVAEIEKDMSSAPPEVALSAMRNLFYYNPIPTLKSLDLPLISINCDMYPVSVEENGKHVKDYEVKFMKGVGHFLMIERPDEFNELLSGSVSSLIKK